LLQSQRRSRTLAQQPCVEHERFVSDFLPGDQALRSQSDKAHQQRRERVRLTTLIANEEAVLLPGAIEEGNQAMIEDVEKVAKPVVLLLDTIEDQLGVRSRHHPRR